MTTWPGPRPAASDAGQVRKTSLVEMDNPLFAEESTTNGGPASDRSACDRSRPRIERIYYDVGLQISRNRHLVLAVGLSVVMIFY